MDFFCTQCQKRHPVGDIAADMWSICKADILTGMTLLVQRMREQMAKNGMLGDDIFDLRDTLTAFINKVDNVEDEKEMKSDEEREAAQASFRTREQVKAAFALRPQDARKTPGVKFQGNLIRVTYTITLGKIVSLYMSCVSQREKEDMETVVARIPENWMAENLYAKDIILYLDDVGVLDKVTDLNNVPIQQGDTLLGFRRVCAHCGKLLSRAAGFAEEIVVALSGSPRAGKSSCMVAMISSLLNQMCPGIRIIPQPNDDVWNFMNTEVGFFNQCKKVTKTPNLQQEVPVYSMLLELNDKKKTRRVLSVVDMPGEFWQTGKGLTAEFFNQYSGLYRNIDCIWFVTSKPTVRLSSGEIPESEKERLIKDTSETAEVIYQASPTNLESNLSMLSKHLQSHQQKMPPMLVIVSKPDYIVSPVDEERTREYRMFPLDQDVVGASADDITSLIRHDNQQLYGIYVSSLFSHGKDVRDYILDCNAQFISAVESNCPDRFYVALSAYGQPALERESPIHRKPTPYHELHPLLWTLMITGCTRAFHNCNWITRNFLGRIVDNNLTVEGIVFPYSKVQMMIDRAKDKQQKKDLEIIYKDLSNNLFMRNGKYTVSDIPHKRG